ncbi:MAG: hypothetical protein HeimC3_33690 [Candidatus Heimdallarchaeota archaeon LC_3]|nr:MAG: hypothetical protein HeimC3_33690 [Candidatus Heimdallarchaeota archaeon LC_3]
MNPNGISLLHEFLQEETDKENRNIIVLQIKKYSIQNNKEED